MSQGYFFLYLDKLRQFMAFMMRLTRSMEIPTLGNIVLMFSITYLWEPS
jgi:2-phosphoglycerate kinase